jgi:hypothetical protein
MYKKYSSNKVKILEVLLFYIKIKKMLKML